ncbi:LysR family transcriptional regulator [Mesorhizobium sp. M1A.F.Ca.ET.072.01.1.1]|nr:LysR family transcriptional regulator [Mesorhizobium sp. M1A.F.Ca.ET.072.01.1.1]TIU98891.1 MAG: LysR family transcriptional regulator [Mesorhizobium sp.]
MPPRCLPRRLQRGAPLPHLARCRGRANLEPKVVPQDRRDTAVSLQVQKLESVIGQRVFERHGRGVAMTAAGERLLPVARDVVEMLNQVVDDLRYASRGRDPSRHSRGNGDTILLSILATSPRRSHGSGSVPRGPNSLPWRRCGMALEQSPQP